MVTTFHYLLLSAALFTIGVIGVLTRRNIMIILMSIELMMNAVNINLIAFSDRLQQVTGQIFAIFVITVAAAEAAVGLGHRHRDVQEQRDDEHQRNRFDEVVTTK